MNIFKNISILILPVLVFVLNYGCSEDNDSTKPPGDFNISVESITYKSALINWTVPENNSQFELIYSIYINDVLLNDNITINEYQLIDLNAAETYLIKLIARNDIGENQTNSSFTTLEIPTLYLVEYLYPSGEKDTLIYNEQKQILHRELTNFPDDFRSDFSYNAEGLLISDSSVSQQIVYSNANYLYQNGSLATINVREGAEIFTIRDYTFDIPTNNYIVEGNEYVFGEIFELPTYENYPIFDSENRLISLRSIDINSGAEHYYSFAYENGNMTKITDQTGDIWEFIFDDKKTFHTYKNGCSNSFNSYEFLGLIALDFELIRRIRLIPYLYGFTNQNNPIEYKLNGESYRTFSYEYNDIGYPVKIFGDNTEIFLTYSEL
tara:strand:- start:648 stop:1787 length:1140 start_codon:yes stop_codon:yes gene_type:complete